MKSTRIFVLGSKEVREIKKKTEQDVKTEEDDSAESHTTLLLLPCKEAEIYITSRQDLVE